jgi:hypothetical protein
VATFIRPLNREKPSALAEGLFTNLYGNHMSIEKEVIDIVVEQLGVDAADVSPSKSFVEDLNARFVRSYRAHHDIRRAFRF